MENEMFKTTYGFCRVLGGLGIIYIWDGLEGRFEARSDHYRLMMRESLLL